MALNSFENNHQHWQRVEEKGSIDMSARFVRENSKKASDIIRRKLLENNGQAIVHTARGLPCEIRAAPDGVSFLSNKLPVNPPYRYEVFDVIADLLISQGGRAKEILSYSKNTSKYDAAIDIPHVWPMDNREYEERPVIGKCAVPFSALTVEDTREIDRAEIWNTPGKRNPDRLSFYCSVMEKGA